MDTATCGRYHAAEPHGGGREWHSLLWSAARVPDRRSACPRRGGWPYRRSSCLRNPPAALLNAPCVLAAGIRPIIRPLGATAMFSRGKDAERFTANVKGGGKKARNRGQIRSTRRDHANKAPAGADSGRGTGHNRQRGAVRRGGHIRHPAGYSRHVKQLPAGREKSAVPPGNERGCGGL